MEEATESILIPASCSTLPSRWISEVRDWTILARYAEARIMPMPGGVAWVPAVAGAGTSA
jgi:hypothetical protein